MFERRASGSTAGYEEEAPLAIQQVALCAESRRLAVALPHGHVVLFKFRKAETHGETCVGTPLPPDALGSGEPVRLTLVRPPGAGDPDDIGRGGGGGVARGGGGGRPLGVVLPRRGGGAARARPGGHGRRAARGRLPARARGAAAGAGAPRGRAHHPLVVRPVSGRALPRPPPPRPAPDAPCPQHGVGRRARRGGGRRVAARRGGGAGARGAVPARRAARAARARRRRPPALAQPRPGNPTATLRGLLPRSFSFAFSLIRLSVARSETPFRRPLGRLAAAPSFRLDCSLFSIIFKLYGASADPGLPRSDTPAWHR